jgi:hypothetical protein
MDARIPWPYYCAVVRYGNGSTGMGYGGPIKGPGNHKAGLGGGHTHIMLWVEEIAALPAVGYLHADEPADAVGFGIALGRFWIGWGRRRDGRETRV